VSSRSLTSGHAFLSCLSRFPSTLRLQTTNCGTLSSSTCPHHIFSMPALAVSSYSCVSPSACYAQHVTKFFFTHTHPCSSQFGMFSLFIREKVRDLRRDGTLTCGFKHTLSAALHWGSLLGLFLRRHYWQVDFFWALGIFCHFLSPGCAGLAFTGLASTLVGQPSNLGAHFENPVLFGRDGSDIIKAWRMANTRSQKQTSASLTQSFSRSLRVEDLRPSFMGKEQ
jgi:hypothetical protein